MNIPEELKVGPHIYHVELRHDIKAGSKELYGHVSYYEPRVIQIATKFGDKIKDMSFLHELIHAVCDLFELDLQERQVSLLAKGLYMVLEDNGLEIINTVK
ncbi:MAG: hypothetical protein AB1523_00095 [Bacillota bacterium]